MSQNRGLTGSFLGRPQIIGQWLRNTNIRSLQRGTVSIGVGATSATATITSVDTANAVLKFLGYSNSGNAVTITEDNCYLELTNATTVTATHNTLGNAIVASFEVIEYWPGVVRSVQRGTFTITNGNTTQTATITAVDTLKTELYDLGTSFTATSTNGIDSRLRFVLTNSTTITGTRIGNTDAVTQSYQAVQWY